MIQQSYPARVGGALSRLLNVTVFNGHPSESLSARTHRYTIERPSRLSPRILRRIINAIFWWEDDHCLAAFIADQEWAMSRFLSSEFPQE